MPGAPIRDSEYRLFEANARKQAAEADLPLVRDKHLAAAEHWGDLAAVEENRARDKARRLRLSEERAGRRDAAE